MNILKRALVLLVLVLLALTACTEGSDRESKAAASTTTTTARPPTSESTAPLVSTTTRRPSPVPTEGAALEPNGRYFGYIKTIDTSRKPATLTFDVAEFLTGVEADRAAEADKAIQPGEGTPGGFYIRNRSHTTRVLKLADQVVVTRVQCPSSCQEHLPGDLEGLVQSFHSPSTSPAYDVPYRGAHSQYWLLLDDGKVTAIDEQYLP